MSIGSTSVLAFTPRPRHRSRPAAACVRVALAAAIAGAPATAALAQSTQTTPTQAQNGRTRSAPTPTAESSLTRKIEGQRQLTPGRLVVPVTGTPGRTAATAADGREESAAAAVNGSFAIQRFARTTEDAVAAVGTLTLTFTDRTTNAARTIVTQAAMPLTRSADIAAPAGSNQPSAGGAPVTSSATAPSTQACETLRLVLGSIDIAPLGVAVQIDRVDVDVTALPGVGERLGALLCDVTSQIAGTTPAAELVTALNALLDMLG